VTTYEVGQTITWGLTTYDSTGAPANVGSMGQATITRPDGTTTTVTPSNTGTGTYQAAIVSTQAGRWRCQFNGTGANSGGLPWTDVADVWPADPRLIISLADAKAELNMPANHTVNDDELRLYVAATTAIVEEIAGRVLATTITETFDGGKAAVLLSERATAITSVVVDGVATTSYVPNLEAGIVYAGTSSSPSAFAYGRQNVVVTYTAGASTIDPNVVAGARIIAAHLYSVGQQGRRRDSPDLVISSGFAVPKRALELLRQRSSYRMPGMA
jgi:hypothetical protein